MMARIVLLAWLALSLSARPSVTVAWRVPSHSAITASALNPNATKLEKPPVASAFFEAGDELWEISKTMGWGEEVKEDEVDPFGTSEKTGPWRGDWIVWNSRSGMLVARGPWYELRRLEGKLSLDSYPMIQRMKVELVTTRGENADPVNESSISLVGRSGEEVKGSLGGIKLKLTSGAYRPDTLSSNRLSLSWPTIGKGYGWHLESAFSAFDGNRTRIAKGKESENEWQVFATITPEKVDGTALNEDRWIEGPHGAIVWSHHSTFRFFRKNLSDDLVLGAYSVPDDLVTLLGGAESEESSFVDSPPEIAEEIRGPFIDVRSLLRENGVKFEDPAAFAGFDTRSLNLVTVTNRESQDLIEGLVSVGREPHAGTWIETNPESGGWGLLCQSGEKSSISRTEEGESSPACVFELTVGSSGHLMDLRYHIDVMGGQRKLGHLEAASTLQGSKPQEIGTCKQPGGDEVKVIITAGSNPR